MPLECVVIITVSAHICQNIFHIKLNICKYFCHESCQGRRVALIVEEISRKTFFEHCLCLCDGARERALGLYVLKEPGAAATVSVNTADG